MTWRKQLFCEFAIFNQIGIKSIKNTLFEMFKSISNIDTCQRNEMINNNSLLLFHQIENELTIQLQALSKFNQ